MVCRAKVLLLMSSVWMAISPLPRCIAADPNLPTTTTSTAETVETVWHGEYAGCLLDANGCLTWMGLQVVPQGNQEFFAVEFHGGLPGNRWNLRNRRSATGKVVDGRLSLEGDGHRYELDGWRVTVNDSNGRELGVLRRFQRTSQTLGAKPPPGAIVLFDGKPTDELKAARMTPAGLLQVGTETTRSYRDFCLHVEFRTPLMPAARGQSRGNSGVYVQGRYEVQILDSFGLVSQNNDCGGLYKQRPPLINMCFPPESWQTYDIDFRAARFDAQGKKQENARITVWQNGIKIHKNVELANKTGAGAPEGPEPRPIKFQDHGDAVLYRNLWIVER